jgi:hypothetical protein
VHLRTDGAVILKRSLSIHAGALLLGQRLNGKRSQTNEGNLESLQVQRSGWCSEVFLKVGLTMTGMIVDHDQVLLDGHDDMGRDRRTASVDPAASKTTRQSIQIDHIVADLLVKPIGAGSILRATPKAMTDRVDLI